MATAESSKIVYYRATEAAQIDNRPYFFGWVEIQGGKVTGEHFKPKRDQGTGRPIIGYYKIEGQADKFLKAFETNGITEITQEDFNIFLSKWTRGGEYEPTCWGVGWTWQLDES